MTIEVNTLIILIAPAGALFGWIISYVIMQKGQNMNIKQLQKDMCDNKDYLQEQVKELKEKQSKTGHYQIKTEKIIVEINTKLEYIVKTIDELKKNGN